MFVLLELLQLRKKCYSANRLKRPLRLDVFRLVDAYFHKNDMKWEKLVGVCTDGAPAMLGCRSGFITRVKQKNPDAVGTHCVIHRETLASKILPAAMKNKLAIVIRIVNFIKSSAVNSRLFSQLCK